MADLLFGAALQKCARRLECFPGDLVVGDGRVLVGGRGGGGLVGKDGRVADRHEGHGAAVENVGINAVFVHFAIESHTERGKVRK